MYRTKWKMTERAQKPGLWRWNRLALGLFLAVLPTTFGQEGRLIDDSVPSRFLGANRGIHVYLPPSYDKDLTHRYPVLYLHDGQNVFSSAGMNICFGWGNWGLDKTADQLSKDGKMQEIIMVAVDNIAMRTNEYSGRVNHALSVASTNATSTNANTRFENYTAFLIEELKPKIDREYHTKTDAANTGVMGSSAGGICSLVLAWQHPEVFGKAASLSGWFAAEGTNFLNSVLRDYHGKPKPVRVYLDSGVKAFMGGDDGCALTGQVAAELRRIGWTNDLNHYVDARPLTPAELESSGLRRDKLAEAQTSQHNELYWRRRSWRALVSLFPTSNN